MFDSRYGCSASPICCDRWFWLSYLYSLYFWNFTMICLTIMCNSLRIHDSHMGGWFLAMRWLWIVNDDPVRKWFIMISFSLFSLEFGNIWMLFSRCILFLLSAWYMLMFRCFSRGGHFRRFLIGFFVSIYSTVPRFPFIENVYIHREDCVFSWIRLDTSVGSVVRLLSESTSIRYLIAMCLFFLYNCYVFYCFV